MSALRDGWGVEVLIGLCDRIQLGTAGKPRRGREKGRKGREGR
jgi:hypothetical protein